MKFNFDPAWLDSGEYTIDALLDLPAAGLIKKLLDLNYPEELTTTYAAHGVMQPEPESDPQPAAVSKTIKMRTAAVVFGFEGKTLFKVGTHDPWRAAASLVGITMSGARSLHGTMTLYIALSLVA